MVIAEIYHIKDISAPYLKWQRTREIIPEDKEIDRSTDIKTEDYTYVYAMKIEQNIGMYVQTDTLWALNSIFGTLNMNHPDDYKYRSLSMGDIVCFREPHLAAYTVEQFGFLNITLPEGFRETLCAEALKGAST
jgi:hypothetical protein